MIIPLFLSFADANNQGLVWGVEEGTQLGYRLTLTETNESLTITVLDEEMYAVIRTLPVIPDDIDGLEELYFPVIADAYLKNGSDLNYNAGYAFFQVFPIGNWPLLTQLYTKFWHDARDIYQDSVMWAIHATEDTDTSTLIFTEQFLKEDGATAYTYIEVYDKILDTTMTIEFVRDGYTKRAPPLINMTFDDIIILGLLGVSVVIASLLIVQFRKSKQVE